MARRSGSPAVQEGVSGGGRSGGRAGGVDEERGEKCRLYSGLTSPFLSRGGVLAAINELRDGLRACMHACSYC